MIASGWNLDYLFLVIVTAGRKSLIATEEISDKVCQVLAIGR
jgi:hypothetical protein